MFTKAVVAKWSCPKNRQSEKELGYRTLGGKKKEYKIMYRYENRYSVKMTIYCRDAKKEKASQQNTAKVLSKTDTDNTVTLEWELFQHKNSLYGSTLT